MLLNIFYVLCIVNFCALHTVSYEYRIYLIQPINLPTVVDWIMPAPQYCTLIPEPMDMLLYVVKETLKMWLS